MNLNQIIENNQHLDEVRTRKRNQSTKIYNEKEEKFKSKNNDKRGVISMDLSKIVVSEKEGKDVKEKEITENLKESLVMNTSTYSEKPQTKWIEEDGLSLPENVERINLYEKTVKDKTTGKDIVIVKKVVFYSDGNQDVSIYKK